MFIDIKIAQLIEADYNFDINTKNNILNSLESLRIDNEIYQSFLLLDSFNKSDYSSQLFQRINLDKMNELLECLKTIKPTKNLNRNSIYIFENGTKTPQLPSHYKFDRTLLSLMDINPNSLEKGKLIVPFYSNTIRVFYNTAVLVYKPTVDQIKELIKLDIRFFSTKKYNDIYDIFDDRIQNLQPFRECIKFNYESQF